MTRRGSLIHIPAYEASVAMAPLLLKPLIIKRRGQAAGISPEDLSGHSLRAGYATAAAAAGVEERKIANVTRHKNLPVLRKYIRAATAFDDVGEVL
jgi:hypothetical protein